MRALWKNWTPLFFMALVWGAAACAAVEKGLVAYYPFDEAGGATAADKSGSGNDGKILGNVKWAKGDFGSGLHFDGRSVYVDCGTNAGLAIESVGTISLWFRPEELQGAFVAWSTGGSWTDQRLILAFNTWKGLNDFIGAIADGAAYEAYSSNPPMRDAWNHIAMTFDGSIVVTYLNGSPRRRFPQGVSPKLVGIPLWIGRGHGLGQDWAKGLMKEVRIYNRALSPEEIVAEFKKKAAVMGRDSTLWNRPGLQLESVPEPGWILARVDCALMQPLPAESVFHLTLHQPGGGEALLGDTARVQPGAGSIEMTLEAGALNAGTYEVRATVEQADGTRVSETACAAVRWPGRPEAFRNVKVLNNLVWEVLNLDPQPVAGKRTVTFTTPKTRWVFVACTAMVGEAGRLNLSLDAPAGARAVMAFDVKSAKTQEAMRFLPAGTHTLALRATGECRIEQLIVRSIPELVYADFQDEPHVTAFGPFAGEFEKRLFRNVNTLIITRGSSLEDPFISEWKRQGKRWIVRFPTPHLTDGDDAKHLTAEYLFEHISRMTGFSRADMDGSIADEFNRPSPVCAAYASAVRKLKAVPEFKEKLFYPYVSSGVFLGRDGRDLVQALVDTGSAIVWKRYLNTQRDERAARLFLRNELIERARALREHCPASINHLILCFGILSAPPEFTCTNPSVNHKAYLDMQFNIVANDPAFWGAYGLMTYVARYSDEETLRWTSHLFRHYGIEGRKKRATDDLYDLPYLQNGDFVRGTEGWTTKPAEEGSIRPVQRQGFGWLQGRYPPSPVGDTALLMTRCAKAPNVLRQKMRNLEPGRLYSFRMFTGDFQDMSVQERHAVSITLDGVTLIPEKCFTQVFSNCYAHHYAPYDDKHKAWMNYHWRVFRANGKSAMLTILDWQTDREPGGPIAQELMYNFVKVQPYFDER